MPSALLFILLAVLWAAVLIPMWLRGHDRATENRSVDRFSRALSSLGRRSGGADTQDTVVVPRGGSARPSREVVMPSRPQGASTPRVTVAGPAATPKTRAGAAARRRRLIVVLLVVAAGLLAGGLLHRIPVWLTAIPLVLVAAVLIGARRAASRRTEMARRRVHREVLSEAARAAQAARESRPVARPGERVIDEPIGYAEPTAPAADADGRWEAVPTTLPTYVTAPAATAVPRVIDRRTPGGLSGAAMVDQARRTRQVQAEDSGMRVESFEIAIPARPTPKQEFAERYVDVTAGAAELDAVDDEAAIEALLADPRSGYVPPRRRAAG